jgi:hypothetical protein
MTTTTQRPPRAGSVPVLDRAVDAHTRWRYRRLTDGSYR